MSWGTALILAGAAYTIGLGMGIAVAVVALSMRGE